MFWMLFTEPRRGFRCENADADTKTSLKKRPSQIYSLSSTVSDTLQDFIVE